MRQVRLLPGRVAIREDLGADTRHVKGIVIPECGTPEERARARTWHRGRVLQVGPPAHTRKARVPIPHGFSPGDEVIFSWHHLEKAWTVPWVDGEMACIVPQECVHAVVESGAAEDWGRIEVARAREAADAP